MDLRLGPPPFYRQAGVLRQRGSVAIMASIFVFAAIVLGIALDAGYLFYMKRNIQKVADMAAAAGAQSLPVCADVPDSVRTNAQANVSAAEYGKLVFEQIDCGKWTLAPDGTGSYTPAAQLASTDVANAVSVTVSESVPSFFTRAGSRTVRATAIAQKTQPPMAAFSVGSGLANIDPVALNGLLSALLGTRLDLSAATYQGLAGANVKLLDLVTLVPLSVGSMDQLLNAQVSVASLLSATLDALSPQQLANLNISASDKGALLQALQLSTVGATQIALSEILDLTTSDVQSALAAHVNAGDLIMLALQAARKDSTDNLIDLGTLINLAPLATVGLKASILEPPRIAIGEAGRDASGNWKTVAHTGQVRLMLDLKGITLPNGATNLLSLPLVLANVNVSLPAGALLDLPLYVEVAPGEAWLIDLQCTGAASARTATIGAASGIANLFLGSIPAAFANTSTLWADLAKQRVNLQALKADIDLLFGAIPLVTGEADLMSQLGTSLNGASGQHVFNVQDIGTPAATWRVGTEQLLGTVLSNALFGSSTALDVQLQTNLSLLGLPLDVLTSVTDALVNHLGTLVKGALRLLGPIVKPVLTALDGGLLGPLLRTLGVQIGYADVRLLWTNCDTAGNVQVVY